MGDEADGYEPVENGAKTHITASNIQELPYADSNDSKPSFKDRFPRFHRDQSKGSGKRDSSRGSDYEPVGWENNNLARNKMSDSKDEVGSKHYEDLDQDVKTSFDQEPMISSAPYDKIISQTDQIKDQPTALEGDNLNLQNGVSIPEFSNKDSDKPNAATNGVRDQETLRDLDREQLERDTI